MLKVVNATDFFWPDDVIAGFIQKDDWYAQLASLLHEGFPTVDTLAIQALNRATQMLARSLIVADKVIDRDETGYNDATLLMGVFALQFKAYSALFHLFDSSSVFWSTYQKYFAEYSYAIVLEQELRSNPSGSGISSVLDIMRSKNALHRGVAAALCDLAGSYDKLPSLEFAIDKFCLGMQLVDDVHDWRTDLLSGTPTYVNQYCGIYGDYASKQITLDTAATRLFIDGAAEDAVSLAIAFTGEAIEIALRYGMRRWATMLEDRRRSYIEYLDRLVEARTRHCSWVTQSAGVSVEYTNESDQLPLLAKTTLDRLVHAWKSGYGELQHLMVFPREGGFSGASTLKRGDVFQRMVILDTFIDLSRDKSIRGLDVLIDQERTYVIHAAEVDPCGHRVWKYFFDLPELPADTDDLAEILRIVAKSGGCAAIAEDLRTNITALAATNGGLDIPQTWIVPDESRHPLHERQREYIASSWGDGVDVEVVANLVDALFLYEPERATFEFNHTADYLIAAQDSSGLWASTWYHGPFYGTYVVLRALRHLLFQNRAHEHTEKALAGLIASQTSSAWGVDGHPDRLSTALALLALSELPNRSDERVRRLANKALQYLEDHGTDDGPPTLFIKMAMPAAPGSTPRIVMYGSATLTDAFVLRAALRWKDTACG